MNMIRIATVILLSLFCTSIVTAQVTEIGKVGRKHWLQWDVPTLNEDGTPLTDLAGYKVAIFDQSVIPGDGNAAIYSHDLPDPVQAELWILTLLSTAQLGAGIYNFAVLAYDEHGNESEWSNYLTLSAKIVRPNKLILRVIKQ